MKGCFRTKFLDTARQTCDIRSPLAATKTELGVALLFGDHARLLHDIGGKRFYVGKQISLTI